VNGEAGLIIDLKIAMGIGPTIPEALLLHVLAGVCGKGRRDRAAVTVWIRHNPDLAACPLSGRDHEQSGP
jgi:hypothetical protein